MNLEEEILKEHSKMQTLRIVEFIGDNATSFSSLMQIFLHGEYRLKQRSSWILSECMIRHPSFINPNFDKMIFTITKTGVHDAVKRNILKVWESCEIPSKHMGLVYDICYRFLKSIHEPLSVRVYSMSILEKLSRNYPELRPELASIIEEMLLLDNPSITSRGNKVLKLLRRKN